MTKVFSDYDTAAKWIVSSGVKLPKPWKRVVWIEGSAQVVWCVSLCLDVSVKN